MALEFNGVDNRIDYPSIYVPLGAAFSFACRFNLSALSGNEYFLLIESGIDEFGFTVWLRDDAGQQGLAVTCSGATASVLKYAVPQMFSLNTWYDLIVTWDGTTSASGIHIYLNDVELAYATSTDGIAPLRAQDGNWIVGGRASDNLRNLSGRIADLAAWRTILTSNERALFSSGQPPSLIVPTNLVFDTRFVGGDTSDSVTASAGVTIGNPGPFDHPTNVIVSTASLGSVSQTLVASNDSPLSTDVTAAISSEPLNVLQSASATVIDSTTSIEITDEYEGGNTDRDRVAILNPESSSPLITLYARPNKNVEGGVPDPIYYSLACRISGVLNKTPTLRLNLTESAPTSIYGSSGWPINWRAWFSYDGSTWQRMSNSSVIGSFQEVSHSTSFTQDTVFFATRPPYNPSRVRAHTDTIKLSAFVSEPSSSLGQDHVYGNSSATVRDGDSLAVPPLELISYRISDDSVGPIDGSLKRKAVLISGLHASEDQGNWQLQAFVDYLLGGSTIAGSLLRDWEFYVYPMVNPSGRWGNAYRGTLQAGELSEDPNRDWPEGTSSGRLQVVTATRTAIEQDTRNSFSAFIDFHGRFREADSIFRFPNMVNDAFIGYVNSRHPVIPVESTTAGGVSETYYRTSHNVPLSITSEGAGFVTSISQYAQLGEALAQAINDSFEAGLFPARNAFGSTGLQPPRQFGTTMTVQLVFAKAVVNELWLH